jgi:hypothetical protein
MLSTDIRNYLKTVIKSLVSEVIKGGWGRREQERRKGGKKEI